MRLDQRQVVAERPDQPLGRADGRGLLRHDGMGWELPGMAPSCSDRHFLRRLGRCGHYQAEKAEAERRERAEERRERAIMTVDQYTRRTGQPWPTTDEWVAATFAGMERADAREYFREGPVGRMGAARPRYRGDEVTPTSARRGNDGSPVYSSSPGVASRAKAALASWARRPPAEARRDRLSLDGREITRVCNGEARVR